MNYCLVCNKETNNIKFCGHKCSAKYTNKTREYKPSKDKRGKKASCVECKRN